MAAQAVEHDLTVIVIGGGQAGLAAGYYLRRAGLGFTILDAQPVPGGAWPHGWDSLRLFSPARHSSLPGWPMPRFPHEGYPTAEHVVDYLAAYEKRYELPVERSVRVRSVRRVDGGYDVDGRFAEAVISATGTWWRPFIPAAARSLPGRQLHTVHYRNPQEFAGQRVVVVGGGNSGAQIAADLASHVDLTWFTRHPPRYLPDEIDGKACSTSPPTPLAGSGPSATSSRSRPCATPATRDCSSLNRWTTRCSPLPTPSSGAPASAPRSTTSHRWACATATATSTPNPACTRSATATGPVPPRPP
ncbi:NAD(P)-binding domain-containing protein [Saccharothrix sp. S26]|uniref:NAD(P)-binding domain-containing protein n=1 Tax=Saccharothrix sp. S26 TaxID=2907215 RepID=UPI001F379F39|nr:NAD(P)-binding domain-containing protein [Saccharothrix sp. S26]MCE6995487.1 NAD(P)-binding domain-containing protein [Saccharothrix sp. S26]